MNPLPSILTTIQVFGSRWSTCSNCLTYSNLRLGLDSIISTYWTKGNNLPRVSHFVGFIIGNIL